MARYDWGRGYGPEGPYGRAGYDYDMELARWRAGRGRRGYLGGAGSAFGRGLGMRGGYDRGIYGGDHPAYGGYPGGYERGMYYGGRGFDADLSRWRDPHWGAERGYDRGWGYGGRGGHAAGGYDRERARAPFMPEEAYRRHPELERRPHRHADRWEEGARAFGFPGVEMDDDEVGQAVRESLHQDGWIRAEAIEVQVSDRVVTLTGEVDDFMQARYAWDDAWETEGVRGVINNLTVRVDKPHDSHGDVVPQTSGKRKK